MKKNILFLTVFLLFNSQINGQNSFTDARDGNTYQIIQIGNQFWMAENLRYLPSVNETNVSSLEDPHFYVYGYNGTDVTAAKATSNYLNFGVLYNWSAAMSGNISSTIILVVFKVYVLMAGTYLV